MKNRDLFLMDFADSDIIEEEIEETVESEKETVKDETVDPEEKYEKYHASMCDQVLDYMSTGMGKCEVAQNLGISYTTLNRWEKEIPEFREALKNGNYLAQAWWEGQGRTNLNQDNKNRFNNTLWIFCMKNKFSEDWRDITEVNQKNTDDVTLKFNLSKMSNQELSKLDKSLENGTARKYLKIVKKK